MFVVFTESQQQIGSFSSAVLEKTIELRGFPGPMVLQKAARRMSDTIKFMRNPALKVLLAINKARNLIETQALDDKNSSILYFCMLHWVISQIPSKMGFFTVFSDTTSWVSNLSPLLDKDPSSRIPKQGFKYSCQYTD
jgi:hypothetical protein